MSRKRPGKLDNFDPHIIHHKRHVEHKTLDEIAKEIDCSVMTLSRFCREHDISRPKLDRKITLDLTDRQFGYLKVLRPLEKRSHCSCIVWECQCTFQGCGKIIERPSNNLMHGRKTNQSCGCYAPVHNYRGREDLSQSYFSGLKRGAAERELAFDIDIDFAWDLFLRQDRKCALTGQPLSLMRSFRRQNRVLQTASLDRIDSSKGYIEGNVQWIRKDLQFVKSDLLDEEFIAICRQVIAWADRKRD